MSNLPSNDFRVSSTFQKRLIYLLRGDTRKNTEIAKDMSISKDILIRAINAGVIPTTKILIKIADYLDTSIEFLIGLTESDSFIKSETNETFQDRLTYLKALHNEKNGSIASDIGISRSLFNSWKDLNYLPTIEIAYQLSRHFHVSIDFLFARTDIEIIQ